MVSMEVQVRMWTLAGSYRQKNITKYFKLNSDILLNNVIILVTFLNIAVICGSTSFDNGINLFLLAGHKEYIQV